MTCYFLLSYYIKFSNSLTNLLIEFKYTFVSYNYKDFGLSIDLISLMECNLSWIKLDR